MLKKCRFWKPLNRLKPTAAAIGILFFSVMMLPAQAGKTVDPVLIQALQQATSDIREQSIDLDSLLWLSSMSDRIDQRIKNPFYRIRLLEAIYTEAKLAGLDPQLVLAVIDIESSFNRYAVSHAGAEGLMQVMPFWKDVYNKPNDDLFNPLVNLRYGCTILRHYMDKHSNTEDALAAYNGSLGRSIYPDKVISHLDGRWQFEEDTYGEPAREKAMGSLAKSNALSQP